MDEVLTYKKRETFPAIRQDIFFNHRDIPMKNNPTPYNANHT